MNVRVSTGAAEGAAARHAVGDIATKIAIAMRAMGVVSHPRNYEILHDVFTGANPALTAEFAALGPRPRQEELDRLSFRYFARPGNHLLVENIREQIGARILEAAALFGKERAHLERYGAMLNETSESLGQRHAISHDMLQRLARIMTTATDSKIEQGRRLAGQLGDTAAQIREARARLEEYKRLADTDPLTRLKNRRVFDAALARLYEGPRRPRDSALLLADIDHFKLINDHFGHPVGDRILRAVAGGLRDAVPEPMLVARTGGEEFAVIIEGVTETSALEMAQALRAAVGNVSLRHARALSGRPITLSVGLCMADSAAGAEDLYARADKALYRSKADGRDRCTMA